jgi:hypothetical protein
MVIAAPSQRMPVATFREFGRKVAVAAEALSDRMRI